MVCLARRSATLEVFLLSWEGTPRPGPGYTGGGLCQAFQVAAHPDSLGTAQTPQWGPNAVRPGEATLLNNNNTIPGHRR